MVADDDHLYALPFSGHTEVLYYNKDLAQTPPTTIAELLDRVAAGETFAQGTRFVDSYWGVGAYDGGIIDSRGRLLFGLGGFTNWLDFLAAARAMPGFMLDADPAVLQQAFIDGKAAYYVADSDEIPDLSAAIGADKLGVALLPSGPNGGVPRPFLGLDALAFSQVASEAEFSLALDLAQFLGGAQNQLFMATENLGSVPVNSQIRLTPSLPADTLTVARQTRSVEPILYANRQLWKDLNAGTTGFFDNYRQVSDGILTPRKMVEQATAAFNATYGMEPARHRTGRTLSQAAG
ncbi:MAG: extracellular solute-binding protein [Tetrasphaera sp.]